MESYNSANADVSPVEILSQNFSSFTFKLRLEYHN